MKKWLDDLYAIILKRGFNTLDNSLKNYDNNQKIIDDNTYNVIDDITINPGETFTYDLNNIDTDNFITLYCISNFGYRFYYNFYKINTGYFITMYSQVTGLDNGSVSNIGVFSIKNSSSSIFTGKLMYKKSI